MTTESLTCTKCGKLRKKCRAVFKNYEEAICLACETPSVRKITDRRSFRKKVIEERSATKEEAIEYLLGIGK